MKMPKIPSVKIPKIHLPSRRQVERYIPAILGGLSIIGNTISTYLFVDTTVKATRKADQMEADGCSKEEIRKEVLPMYTIPMATFVASNACTVGAVASAEAQISGLITGMAAVDYRNRKLKEQNTDEPKIKQIDISNLPSCKPGEILFYDEYLETGKQDGYFAISEADWWQAYAEFIEDIQNPNMFPDFPTYADFYHYLPKEKMFDEMLHNVGSWPYYAHWELYDMSDVKLIKKPMDTVYIDENTQVKMIEWLWPPVISDWSYEQGYV